MKFNPADIDEALDIIEDVFEGVLFEASIINHDENGDEVYAGDPKAITIEFLEAMLAKLREA